MWFNVGQETQHGAGGLLTLAGRCRSHDSVASCGVCPTSSCGAEPVSLAEKLIQVHILSTTPGSTLGDQHRKAARPLGNNPVDHPPQAPEHIHIASRQGIGRQLGGFFGGSSGSLVIKPHAVRIWGLTCPGTSATSSCSREPPPRRCSHCIPVKGSPRVVGALRATLAEGALEELGDMPETKRMSTTADTSAGCGVQSLRAVGCCVCSRGSECRPNLVAASTAIFGGRCETSRFTHEHPLGL